MKLSNCVVAAVNLTMLAVAAPSTMLSTAVQRRAPIGSFIWSWYGDDQEETHPSAESAEESMNVKRSTMLKARKPIGSFIWSWYGDDQDENEPSVEVVAEETPAVE
ncbi:uncharacterized protein BO80DRAFT_435698 [Aspergillus ibericus CBS 121593]|uniref:Uncharacterized protein n=1 Tax=Aspergillus ibericus CBS 121593 TaxID=1448316 RepID=A0A395GX80_9EURO|nr:hypothetical protein BO80DRAFT_435698 [Aspergillus ibericus CBS 121593]RAL00023.1 hypothetical protein BO80DRAFT_435698 [Aspergillus ibericus CBS 121593]